MESELSSVVDALPGWVWTARPDGHLDFVNRRWCEYSGLRVDDAYGCGWQTTVHPEDLTQLVESWRAILASGQPGEMVDRADEPQMIQPVRGAGFVLRAPVTGFRGIAGPEHELTHWTPIPMLPKQGYVVTLR
jgi:PAS domain-containing protein